MNTNIGGSYSQIGGPQGVPVPSETTSPSVKHTGYSSKDQLSAAEIEEALLLSGMLSANKPTLSPDSPSGVLDVDSVDGIVASSANRLHEIIMNVLDAWDKNLKEIAERTRKDEERKDLLGIVPSFKAAVNHVYHTGDTGTLAFIGSGIVVSSAYVGHSMGIKPTDFITANPQIDQSQNSNVWSSIPTHIPDDMRAELGLLGTLMMNMAVQYTNIEQVGKGKGTATDTADVYASKVLKMVGSDQIGNFLMALMVNRGDKAETVTPERLKELTAMVKTILLATALAGLYKASYGKMSAQEFQDLLSGKMAPKTDAEKELVNAMKEQLADLGGEGGKLVASLANWASTTDFELKPNEAFASFMGTQGLPLDTMKS